MDDVTLPELARRVDEDRAAFKEYRQNNDRRFNDYVQQALYDRDMAVVKADIGEMKDTLKWAARGVGGLFIAVIIDIIVRVATSGVAG